MDYIKMSPLVGMVGYGGGGTGLSLNAAAKKPGWLGDRGCFNGGYWSGHNRGYNSNVVSDIFYVTIATTGNAADFANMTEGRMTLSAGSGEGRGIQPAGQNTNGNTATKAIDYWAFATLADAADFGDMQDMERSLMTASNGVRAVMSGGYPDMNSGKHNVMEYLVIQTTGNSTDFGDVNTNIGNHMSVGNFDRVFIVGGDSSEGSSARYKNELRYVTVDTPGNTNDFGDLDYPRWDCGGTGDATRAMTLGGKYRDTNQDPANINNREIRYFSMDTQGSTSDFGDIVNGSNNNFWGNAGYGTCGNNERGVMTGSEIDGSRVNNIDYITIQTTGNSTDFGDMPGPIGYGNSHSAGT